MRNNNETKFMLQELSQSNLKETQSKFIKSLWKWYKKTGTLSDKQTVCLKSIYEQQFRQVEMNHLIK
jgi:hypothetical protein